MIERHAEFMANQLVDSQLASTREFWRRKLGLPEDIVKDPRPLAEIMEKHP